MIKKIWHLFQRAWKQTIYFPRDVRYYGLKVAIYIWKDRVLLGKGKDKYIDVVQQFVDSYLDNLVEEYRKKTMILPEAPQVNTVWCCWWQGKKTMPEIVKMCTESIRQSLPEGIRFVLITEKNYNDYVNIPDYIIEKLDNGVMSITAFSDILRVALLSKYGGFWIDATVCIPKTLPKEWFQKNYFTQCFQSSQECPGEACRGKWAGFLQCGTPEFLFFSFVRDAYYKWWKEHDSLIDYVILDYFIMTAYNKIPVIQYEIDNVPSNNEKLWELQKLLSKPFDVVKYEYLFEKQYFNKLARTLEPNKVDEDGNLTYYGYLCNCFLKND